VSERWIESEDIRFLVGIALVVLFAIGVAYHLVSMSMIADDAKRRCVEAGYYDATMVFDGWHREFYCVGLEDGGTVTISLEDLN
jgi:hypothetical protein